MLLAPTMKKERVVLSFVAVLIGLLVATIIFYLYQATKTITPSKITNITIKPSPTLAPFFLSIDSPIDESVVSNKILPINGKTESNATVVIITPVDQQVVSPSSVGDFSTTVTLDNGENNVEITAIGADGQETKVDKTVTYSTDNF